MPSVVFGRAARAEPQRVFSAAPHRMMFFAGAAQLVLTMAFWLVELTGRFTGLWSPLATTLPSTWAHALLMLFGMFPFFMFGFLMTTYPRWMGGTTVPKRCYAGAFWLMAAGAAMLYVGLFWQSRVVAAGLALLLAGWAVGLYALFTVYAEAPARDKTYEAGLNVALTLGWLALASYLVWMLTGNTAWLNLSLRGGLWLFLVPVVFIVSHRMIPFFSSTVIAGYRVVQPPWSIPLMWVCVGGHAALEAAGALRWLFVFDLPLALLALHHTWHWGLRPSLRVRLLAVLHIAFLWLAIAMLLYSVQSLVLLATGSYVLGRAPLHALTIGCLAGMTVAMASRVTLGHSGRPLVADAFTWTCFLGLNAAAITRVAADLPLSAQAYLLNIAAALIWLLCLGAWVGRYAPMYLRPRADGRAG